MSTHLKHSWLLNITRQKKVARPKINKWRLNKKSLAAVAGGTKS